MRREEIERHVRSLYDAFAARDEEAYRDTLAPDIVWHVPGDNPVSGEYRGLAEYTGTMPERMGPLDRWEITVHSVTTNEQDRAALVSFHVVGERRGKTVDMGGHHMIRLDENGRIAEGWGFAEDQAALDEFFRA